RVHVIGNGHLTRHDILHEILEPKLAARPFFGTLPDPPLLDNAVQHTTALSHRFRRRLGFPYWLHSSGHITSPSPRAYGRQLRNRPDATVPDSESFPATDFRVFRFR